VSSNKASHSKLRSFEHWRSRSQSRPIKVPNKDEVLISNKVAVKFTVKVRVSKFRTKTKFAVSKSESKIKSKCSTAKLYYFETLTNLISTLTHTLKLRNAETSTATSISTFEWDHVGNWKGKRLGVRTQRELSHFRGWQPTTRGLRNVRSEWLNEDRNQTSQL